MRTAILLFLDEQHRRDPSRITDDIEIAEAFDVDLDEIRRQLDILEGQELTKSANTFGGHSAYISPRGMAAVDEIRASLAGPSPRPIGFEQPEE